MFTRERRSEIMSHIRSSDTQPELTVRRFLHRSGFRFRLHRKQLPGKPDIVLPRHGMAIFVHGCFWHGHECKDGHRPKSNSEYWTRKLDRNLERDARVQDELRQMGWKPVVIWSCEARNPSTLEHRLREYLPWRA